MLDHWSRLCTELGCQHVGSLDKHDARFLANLLPSVVCNAAAHLGCKFYARHPGADDDKRVLARRLGTRRHLPQVTIEGYCTIVAVDVERVFCETRNRRKLKLTPSCQDQPVISERIACCGLALDRNGAGRSID